MRVTHGTNNWMVLKRVCAVTTAVCCSLCLSAQSKETPKYRLVDLGVVGPAGQPFHITNDGFIAGVVESKTGPDHAVLYFDQYKIDISKPGLGGANSEAIGVNLWGQVVGGANTPKVDPHGEDFCGLQSSGIASATASCRPFLWQDDNMTALPTLDGGLGDNGVANAINDNSEIAGAAENTTIEASCPAFDPSMFQFQQYQFKPVVWRHLQVEQLATVAGDPVGSAVAINNQGQVVGTTGTCAVYSITFGFPMQPRHAVMWEKDGSPKDLGSLGGNERSVWGSVAEAINSSGHVAGSSTLKDNATLHAFFWSSESGMKDLGTASGLPNSQAIAINDSDVIVGISTDFQTMFIATIWKHGVATDLNTLIGKSSLHLFSGCSINSRGEIIGLALDANGNFHGYKLIPNNE